MARTKSVVDIHKQVSRLTARATADRALFGNAFSNPDLQRRAKLVKVVGKRYINNIKNSNSYKKEKDKVFAREYKGWLNIGWHPKNAKFQSQFRSEFEANQKKFSRSTYMGANNG